MTKAADLAMQKPEIIKAAIDAKIVTHDAPIAGAGDNRALSAHDRRLEWVSASGRPASIRERSSTAFSELNEGAGAIVTFTGLVRSTASDPIESLTLECCPELALNQIGAIAAEAACALRAPR